MHCIVSKYILQGTNGHETQMMERMVEEGYGDLPRF